MKRSRTGCGDVEVKHVVHTTIIVYKRDFRILAFSISSFLEFRLSGFLAFWISGFLKGRCEKVMRLSDMVQRKLPCAAIHFASALLNFV